MVEMAGEFNDKLLKELKSWRPEDEKDGELKCRRGIGSRS